MLETARMALDNSRPFRLPRLRGQSADTEAPSNRATRDDSHSWEF